MHPHYIEMINAAKEIGVKTEREFNIFMCGSRWQQMYEDKDIDQDVLETMKSMLTKIGCKYEISKNLL